MCVSSLLCLYFRFLFTPHHTNTEPGITYAVTFTKILSLQHITILYFIILIIHNFSEHSCKRPKDGLLTPKHVGEI